MKQRNSFVSNSSSSSFTIGLKYISAYQLEQLKNHISEAKVLEIDCNYNESDAWEVQVMNNYVECSTDMDNFDMDEFLLAIGVNLDFVKYD